ncbi:unnamed protein product [Lymnaea stagnalis]|uniref:Uncharacterized protein n=1 Tax=Lymnaea stagnalis TaxID=6523 RepID=A0AAV2IBZ0_LYMST
MASKVQQVQRFTNFISQQLEILKQERKNLRDTADDAISQVQGEVDAWVHGGLVNQSTCARMNNRIQQVITLLMAKTVEISDLEIKESESEINQMTLAKSNDSTNPKLSHTSEESEDKTMPKREDTLHKSGEDTDNISTMRISRLEEAVLSLKKTTEHSQEKQEIVNKKLEILTNANLKSKTKIQGRLTELEKTSKEISSNVDDLFETVTNVDEKLNRSEDENKSVNVSMNELNKQISSVRTCSNDALMSIQDLSKSVESSNQNYNEMSNKMDQLEISINLMSSQYTEQFENMSSLNTDKVDDMFGMVCQILAKRLTPLEELRENLNTTISTRKELSQKVQNPIYDDRQKPSYDDAQHRVAFTSAPRINFWPFPLPQGAEPGVRSAIRGAGRGAPGTQPQKKLDKY